MLTFIGGLYAKDALRIEVAISFATRLQPAFVAFAIGVALLVVVSFFAYINWTIIAHTYYGPGQAYDWVNGQKPKVGEGKGINATMALAILVGFGSLGSFLVGSYKVAAAFNVLGVP